MFGWMAIGYGTAVGSGLADTGQFRRFPMRCGFMAAGYEAGVAFIASADIGADRAGLSAKHEGESIDQL